ncbi:hypothetical protein ACROYT_G007758 [Oculina patagonica]
MIHSDLNSARGPKCVEVLLTRLSTAFYRITTQRIISLTDIILASALKCYVCAGTGDSCSKSALEGDKDKYLLTCPSEFDQCIQTWLNKDGNTTVASSCANQNSCNLTKASRDTLSGNDDSVDCTVDCCSSDACNAVSTKKASGLKCYKCDGKEEDCKKSTLEGDKDKYLKTCSSGEDKCMRIWANKDGEIFVANSCANQLECSSVKASCDELEDSEDVDCADIANLVLANVCLNPASGPISSVQTRSSTSTSHGPN